MLLNMRQAAKAAGMSRGHFYATLVQPGVISVIRDDPKHPMVDPAEILRVRGKLLPIDKAATEAAPTQAQAATMQTNDQTAIINELRDRINELKDHILTLKVENGEIKAEKAEMKAEIVALRMLAAPIPEPAPEPAPEPVLEPSVVTAAAVPEPQPVPAAKPKPADEWTDEDWAAPRVKYVPPTLWERIKDKLGVGC